MKLKDKVAIITGSTKGIGKEASILFAKEGAKVIVNGRDSKRGREVVKEIESMGDVAKFYRADVSISNEVEELVKFTINEFGKIDILYNNAAIYMEGLVHEFSEENWDKVININLKSVFLCCKYVIPEMLKNNGGVIINTSSTEGLATTINIPAYCASKAGIINLTRSMALDYGRTNIRVNCICPGVICTQNFYDMVNWFKDPQREIVKWTEVHPIGRLGRPVEVANAALFLASEEASFITGAILVVDGGQSVKFWTPWKSERK